MTIDFSDLVKLYRKADFGKGSVGAQYCIENDEMLSLVEILTSDNNAECTRIEILKGKPRVGEIIELEILQPKISLGWLYNSFEEFIKGDFLRTLPHSNNSKKPYYIKSINYYSEEDSSPEIIVAYDSIKMLLLRLESMSAYLDSSSRKIIFVGKQTFELDYDVSKNLVDFETLIKECAKDLQGKIKVVDAFCVWLDDDEISKHSDEKRSILAAVLSDIQIVTKPLSMCEIVENIEFLNISARGQFSIYLENFKYEKFVQKLEENSEKFISRVNESISKVLSQILALPIAAAAPVILKGRGGSGEVVIYTALLVYAIICYFALSTQKAILNHLKDEMADFDTQGKLPESLRERWGKEKIKISLLINKQTQLYWVMIAVVYVVVLYGFYNISSAIAWSLS